MEILFSATPGPERAAAFDNARHRIVEHAATNQGSAELAAQIDSLQHRAPLGLRRRATLAHHDLIAALESLHQQGAARAEMLSAMATPQGRADIIDRTRAQLDRHHDARQHGTQSRHAAAVALRGRITTPMSPAGLREHDEVLIGDQHTGLREIHTVVSAPKFTSATNPNTGAPVSQVEVTVQRQGATEPRTAYFNAYEDVTVRRLART